MQTYFYIDEVSRHCQSHWQRSATRKMTGKYITSGIVVVLKKDPIKYIKELTAVKTKKLLLTNTQRERERE